MSNQLDILIKLYEEEKSHLESLIKGSIDDPEGHHQSAAYFHQQAINQLTNSLMILNHFKNPHYEEIQRLLFRKSWLKTIHIMRA